MEWIEVSSKPSTRGILKRIRSKYKDLAVLNIQKGRDLTADDRVNGVLAHSHDHYVVAI